MQYSKLGLSRLHQFLVFKSASVTVDKNAFQNPQLAILQNRWASLKETILQP